MRRGLLRLLAGWSLLAVAWALANPPFAAPDELDHYVRAVGIAEGHLIGSPAPGVNLGSDPAEIRFDKSTQRAVTVPARLDPDPYNCYIANARLSAACIDRAPLRGPPVRLVTSVGDYPPLGLLAPAAVLLDAHGPLQAVRLGRLAAMVIALAFLLAAAAAVFDAASPRLSLVGVLAACTPMALFLAGSMNPSGLSIAAGIALCAALLRIGRRDPAPPGVWLLLGLSGPALALSHPTGLAWAALLVAGFVAWEGRATVSRLAREQGRRARPALVLLGLGIVAAVVWQELYGPSTPIAYRAIRLALGRLPAGTWNGFRDLVAGFGYLEFRLPLVVYLLWFAFVAALAWAAARAGSRRDRFVIAVAGAIAILISPAIWMVFGRATGIGISGREYMPVLVGFPMLCGEILYRHRARISHADGVLVTTLATCAGVIQFVAWYLNGRRSAVGVGGSLLYPSHPGWSPPLGWALWLFVAAAGAVLVASVVWPRSDR